MVSYLRATPVKKTSRVVTMAIKVWKSGIVAWGGIA
jgi:hypothetical protein